MESRSWWDRRAVRREPPLTCSVPHVRGEPGAKSFVDDLILGQGFVRSRAATSLRSIESQPLTQAFVFPSAKPNPKNAASGSGGGGANTPAAGRAPPWRLAGGGGSGQGAAREARVRPLPLPSPPRARVDLGPAGRLGRAAGEPGSRSRGERLPGLPFPRPSPGMTWSPGNLCSDGSPEGGGGLTWAPKVPPALPGVDLVPGLAAARALPPKPAPGGRTPDPDNRRGLKPPSSAPPTRA